MNSVATLPDLKVEHLAKERLLDVWPVLAIGAGEQVPTWWEHEANELHRRGGGVLVARRSDGLVQGLATYEPVDRPKGSRVLAVERLITFELSLRKPVRNTLLRSLDLLADALRCTSVALPLETGSADQPCSLQR